MTKEQLALKLSEEIENILEDCTTYAKDWDQCEKIDTILASKEISKLAIGFAYEMFIGGYMCHCGEHTEGGIDAFMWDAHFEAEKMDFQNYKI